MIKMFFVLFCKSIKGFLNPRITRIKWLINVTVQQMTVYLFSLPSICIHPCHTGVESNSRYWARTRSDLSDCQSLYT